MAWQNLYLLWFLLAIPLLIAGIWWYRKQHQKKWSAHFGQELFHKLRQNYWSLGNRLRTIALYIGMAFLIVAMAGPKIGTSVKQVKRQGVNLVVALDLSASMNAEDVKPSRLKKAKYELGRLIDRLNGSRIGFIVFTGAAYLQSPLTLDYSTVRLYLNNAETDLMPNTATDLSEAMEVASKAFESVTSKKKEKKASNVLLIVSDGGNHNQPYNKALSALKKQNITVYTLGIGTKQGGPIPVYSNSGKFKGYKKNKKGEVVVTKLHADVLRRIAQKGGGEYYQISSGQQSINAFLQQLDKLKHGVFSSKKYTDYANQYQWLAGIGLAFVVISLVLSGYRKSD